MTKTVIMDSTAGADNADNKLVDLGAKAAAKKQEKVVDLGAGAAGLPARAVKNGDGTITLPLRLPVSIKVRDLNDKETEERFDAFTFHYLKGADIRAIQAAKPEMANIVAFSRSTGINQAIMDGVFDDLHIADINDGAAIMSFFTNGGQ